MKSLLICCTIVFFACFAIADSAQADPIRLEWVPSGMSPKVGYYQPQQIKIIEDKPERITKLPEGVEQPRFAVAAFGAKETPTFCTFLLSETSSDKSKLWIDANGNGDFTDDPAIQWTSTKRTTGSLTVYQWRGRAELDVAYGDESRTLSISMYRFDPNDPKRQRLKDVILYYRDFGYSGIVKIGDTEYKASLIDDSARGDFRGCDDKAGSKLSLLLDINKSGKFELRGERFDARQPFNIGGTTYEITGLTPIGGTFEIVKSKKSVPERLVPAIVKIGKQPPAFEASTLDGRKLKFPEDFKGRLVMLDFWATWCGPCRAELPNLRSVYDEFHDQGFDVLSVSIDDAEDLKAVNEFVEKNAMDWQHVNDEGFDGSVPSRYGVSAIPSCWLVDGESGLIVADTAALRGSRLRGTIERRLEQLGEPPSDELLTPKSKPEDPLLVKARDLVEKEGFTNGITFRELRKSPTGERLSLLPASTKRLRGRDIARRAADAHVRCGWLFHCSRCRRWHLNLAGGFAIAPDAFVTAYHVVEDPSTSDLDKAYLIAVIGDEKIVPVTSVVAADRDMDAVVLRVGASDLKPLALHDDVLVGDSVYCLSDPQGIRSYFSTGLVNRDFNLRDGSDPSFHRLHVSSQWAKGSSGSAVLDESGNAVGHVVRMRSLFQKSDRKSAPSATVLNLHEAVPAGSLRSLLNAPR
jgi:thiol-disulfide isomerase/thioredoxin